MLHNEARKLLIEAVEKTLNVQEVADCYSVNRSTVYQLRATRQIATFEPAVKPIKVVETRHRSTAPVPAPTL